MGSLYHTINFGLYFPFEEQVSKTGKEGSQEERTWLPIVTARPEATVFSAAVLSHSGLGSRGGVGTLDPHRTPWQE